MKNFLNGAVKALFRWQIWVKLGALVGLATLWPTLQDLVRPSLPWLKAEVSLLMVPLADLSVMLFWREKHLGVWKTFGFLGWGITLAGGVYFTAPLLGYPVAIFYALSRVAMVAAIMTIRD